MKINEKIITGMYYYDPDLTYTTGDFVISPNNYLYVVSKEVCGKNPEEGYPEYFKPYQYSGSNIEVASYEDFVNFLSTQNTYLGDKVITIDLLSKILDNYLTGIDSSGKITSSIFSNEIWFTNYLGDLTKTTCDSDPLDIILEMPELNNAYFIIQDTLILNELGIVGTQGSDEVTGILRQYTYEDAIGKLTRVQEVIEPASGTLLFRYSISPDGKSFEKIKTSSWRGSIQISEAVNPVVQAPGTYSLGSARDTNLYGNIIDKISQKVTATATAENTYYNGTTWTNNSWST